MSSIAEFQAGIVAGWSQILTGQPFDILKVRLQSNVGKSKGSIDCLKQIVQKEGILALYKGSSYPLLLAGSSSALVFGIYQNMQQIFGNDSFHQLFTCGAIAGVFGSIVNGPMEHIRIRVQSVNSKYKGSKDAFNKIYKRNGLKGIYKGQLPTICREIFMGLYLGVYTFTVQNTLDEFGNKQWYSTLLGSIFGGSSYWIFNYPFDTIKTKIQTDSFSRPKYRSIQDCANKIYKKQGIKGFYVGLLPCLIRSIPVSLAVFTTYEFANEKINVLLL